MGSFCSVLAPALTFSSGFVLGAALPAAGDALQPRGKANIAKSMLEAIRLAVDTTVYAWVSKIHVVSISSQTHSNHRGKF